MKNDITKTEPEYAPEPNEPEYVPPGQSPSPSEDPFRDPSSRPLTDVPDQKPATE